MPWTDARRSDVRRLSRKYKYLILLGLLIVGGIVTAIALRRLSTRRYSRIEEGAAVSLVGTEQFTNRDGRLFITTENGMRGLDGDCSVVMDVAFELDHPMTVSCGDVAAIGDIGGTKVYVMSSNGIPHKYTTELPIVKLCVAEDGTTAVLLDNDTKDVIRVYSPEGELKVEIGTGTASEGFPVDIALSRDGKKLVSLYLSFSAESVVSKVTFYNMGDVGKNFIENIVGQKIYSGEMAYSADFMGNDHVAVIFGKGFSVFSMEEIPTLIRDERYEARPLDIKVCDSCVVTLSAAEDGRTIAFYDTKGAVSGRVTGLSDTEGLTVTNGEAMLIGNGRVRIYRMNGTVKLDCRYEGGCEKLYSGGGNKYLAAGADSVKAMYLVK